MAQSVGQFVQEITRGRGYIFVIMPYEHCEASLLFGRFKFIVENEFKLACLRADDVRFSGYDLLEKIHQLIDRADLVVAEISGRGPAGFSPNVYYEVGYAAARGKQLLLIANSATTIPTDLRGLELIRYGGDLRELERFESEFRQHLQLRLGSRVALLRDMLVPDDPTPSLVVASPKYPGRFSRIQGQRYDLRTFGDNLGIVGILSTFGAVLGESTIPELVSAEYHHSNLENESVNLYLIGSKKVNALGGTMLERIQLGRAPNWYLGGSSPSEEVDDYPVTLFGALNGSRAAFVGMKAPRGDGGSEIHVEDYGVIVRAPHPSHPNRLVTILAGAHSLGTGAACIAATRSEKIEEIRTALGDKAKLGDKQVALWVLVKGTAGRDGMLDNDSVNIVEAGVYEG